LPNQVARPTNKHWLDEAHTIRLADTGLVYSGSLRCGAILSKYVSIDSKPLLRKRSKVIEVIKIGLWATAHPPISVLLH